MAKRLDAQLARELARVAPHRAQRETAQCGPDAQQRKARLRRWLALCVAALVHQAPSAKLAARLDRYDAPLDDNTLRAPNTAVHSQFAQQQAEAARQQSPRRATLLEGLRALAGFSASRKFTGISIEISLHTSVFGS